MKSHALRALAATVLFAAVGGCSDPVTSGAGRAPADASYGLVSGLLTSLVQRLVPLAHDYSASATIGTAGGSIRIPEAGFTITFPAGAVSAPAAVKATALAGGNVAYRLEPHGLVFQKEPTIAQDLSLTGVVSQLLTAQLAGGYVPDESTLQNGTAVVTETRPATLDLLRLRTTFTIGHFSAYAVTSRKGGYMGSSGNRTTGR
jgi:integral membrane sensor domain MASE1